MYTINKVSAIHLETNEYVYNYTLKLETEDEMDEIDDFWTKGTVPPLSNEIAEDIDYDDYEMCDWKCGEEFDKLEEAEKRFEEIKANPESL